MVMDDALCCGGRTGRLGEDPGFGQGDPDPLTSQVQNLVGGCGRGPRGQNLKPLSIRPKDARSTFGLEKGLDLPSAQP